MYKTILLAYDGSREGLLALREGALLAKTCGANVVLLSVIPNSSGAAEIAQGVGGALASQIDDYRDLLNEQSLGRSSEALSQSPSYLLVIRL